jgi:hypothetical protein
LRWARPRGDLIPLAQLLKPYPRYTTVSLYRNNVGTTTYRGVYAKVEQRFSRGLSYLVSYTRSKLVDGASSVFDASILTGPVANFPVADSFNRRLERDYSTGDIPHVFVASAVWDLPFGRDRRMTPSGIVGALVNDWTLSGVLTLQAGMPVAVTQTTNNNAFAGLGTQRPNVVGDPNLPAGERSVNRWFNTAPSSLRRRSRSARAPGTLFAVRVTATSTWPSCGASRFSGREPWKYVLKASTSRTDPISRRPIPSRARRRSARSPGQAIRASCSWR